MTEKLKMVKKIKEKSGNFAKFSAKLKFFTLKKFMICHTYAILST